MFNLNDNIEFASGKRFSLGDKERQKIKRNYAHIPNCFKSHKLYSESDTSSSSAGPNIGAGRSGDAGRLGAAGGHGVGGGPGVGGRGVGQMAPMLKPRLGDMYQEESEAEGQFNPILTVTLILASTADNENPIYESDQSNELDTHLCW